MPMSSVRQKDCESADLENVLESILNSIALIEDAIARVIDAEGEKIQYALGTLSTGKYGVGWQPPQSVDELTALNLSVQGTVTSLTGLECILRDKMWMALTANRACAGEDEKVWIKPDAAIPAW